MQRITNNMIESLPLPPKGNKVHRDTETKGFGIRVTSAGAKSFVLKYVMNGRERSFTIGEYAPSPGLNTSSARAIANELKGEIAQGHDPLDKRIGLRKAPTVFDLCEDYLERHARPHKRLKSVQGDESIINNYILPKLGGLKVGAIRRTDIDDIHQSKHLKEHPYQANRVLALLSKMFNLAIEWEWIGRNPAKGVKKYHEEQRHRWLSTEEISKLTSALEAYQNKRAVNAIRLIVLTGSRKSEVFKAEWSNIDFERKVWTKPSAHTKQKRTEHLPLSAHALDLLSGMKDEAIPNVPFIFPGDAPGKPIQDIKKAWRKIVTDAGLEGVRINDLRHTYASHLVSGGLSLEIVGRLLGHTQASTTKRYAHLADDPLREATNRMGAIVEVASGERETAEIVPINKGA